MFDLGEGCIRPGLKGLSKSNKLNPTLVFLSPTSLKPFELSLFDLGRGFVLRLLDLEKEHWLKIARLGKERWIKIAGPRKRVLVNLRLLDLEKEH